jgi:hypothetical protein
VTLTEEGAVDRLFRCLPRELPVFPWHGDTFAVPAGGTLLATGRDCRNQAFRRRRAWGLQFHLEAEREMIAAWFAGTPQLAGMLRRHEEIGRVLADHATLPAVVGEGRQRDGGVTSTRSPGRRPAAAAAPAGVTPLPAA